MRTSSLFGFLLIANVGMLAGCSGSGAQTPVPSAPVSAHRFGASPFGMQQANIASTRRTPFVNVAGVNAVHGNQTIIADAASGTVTVWGGHGQLNAILFDGIAANPSGLATDRAENLYVANHNISDIIVYPKPYTSIGLTMDDAGEYPQDVAVSNTGLVGVTNYLTTSLQPGSVSFYAKGSSSACATIGDSRWIYFIDAAFDASGNLFIDGQDINGNTLVGELSGGCSATSISTLSVGNRISSPGSVQVYAGKILIQDPLSLAVYTYAPPSGGSLGSPTATTKLAGAIYPTAFTITKDGLHLWTADFNPSGFAGQYTYPGGSFVKAIRDHLTPVGIAVNPAARP